MEERNLIQGTFLVRLQGDKYYWNVERDTLRISGGPYSTTFGAVIGMLSQLTLVLLEQRIIGNQGKEVSHGIQE